MQNSKLNLTEKQLKVLTWKEDVEGLVAERTENGIVIFYELAPNYERIEISTEDFEATLQDIVAVKTEMKTAKLNSNIYLRGF